MVRTKLCAQTIAEEKRWWSWYWNLGEVALVFYIAVASLWTPWDDKNPKDRSTPVSNKENRNSNNPSLEHRCIHGANQRFRSVLNLLTDLPVSFKQQGSTVHSPWQELGGQVSDDSIFDACFVCISGSRIRVLIRDAVRSIKFVGFISSMLSEQSYFRV